MKTKIYTSIVILASLLLLASCSASPESATRNMTSADYENNKETIEKIDVAKSYIGMMSTSSEKGLSIDNQAKTITYEVSEPIGIIRNDLVEELPILSTLLPQTQDFWIISGKTSISFAGYESIAGARTIDDVFKVASMNLVFADNKEGTLNRTEVSITYEEGVGTLAINGRTYTLSSLEQMRQYAEAVEDVISTFLEEEALHFEQGAKTFAEVSMELFSSIGEPSKFTFRYQDIEEDERFIIDGIGLMSASMEDGKPALSIMLSGKLTDSEDDEHDNIIDADFAIKFNMKLDNTFAFELEEASIAGSAIWDSLFAQIESEL